MDGKELMARMLRVEQITPTLNQCTNGSYTRCYKVGTIVLLSFNINITTASSNYDYLTNIPKAIGSFACCAAGVTGSTTMSCRFWVTPDGTLRSDGTPTLGWYNGSIAYICNDSL